MYQRGRNIRAYSHLLYRSPSEPILGSSLFQYGQNKSPKSRNKTLGALIYAFEHAYEFNPGTINSLITLITNIYKWALSIVSSILKHFNQQWFFSMILGLISDLTDLVKPKRLIWFCSWRHIPYSRFLKIFIRFLETK